MDEFIEDKSDSKSRLIELKSLLDDGLISQDQYDLKSSEILNDLWTFNKLSGDTLVTLLIKKPLKPKP